jgi:predicted nuclease of predicted toxin-antitoxin system
MDVVHVQRLGWDEKSDLYLWNFSVRESRIVVTKDEDFFNFANRPRDKGRVLWLKLGNLSTRKLLAILELEWTVIIRSFENGNRIVELSESGCGS